MRTYIFKDGMLTISSENKEERAKLQAFINECPERMFLVELVAGKVDYNREIQIGLTFVAPAPNQPQPSVSAEPEIFEFGKRKYTFLPKEGTIVMEEIWRAEFRKYMASLLNEDEKWDEKVYAQAEATFKAGWDRCYGAHKVSQKTAIAKALLDIQKVLPETINNC